MPKQSEIADELRVEIEAAAGLREIVEIQDVKGKLLSRAVGDRVLPGHRADHLVFRVTRKPEHWAPVDPTTTETTEHVNDNDNPYIRTMATRARHEDRAAPQEPPNDD